MDVRCLEVKGVKHDTLKAIARVVIEDWGLIMNDVKLFKKNDSTWVAFPDKMYEKDGKKNYFPLNQMVDKKREAELKDDIRKAILKELEIAPQANQHNKEMSQYSFDGIPD